MDPLYQDQSADGFVDGWNSITLTDPPPPAPFRFLSGTPIDLLRTQGSSAGKESQVKVTFIISMGTVGNIHIQAGNAPGVMAATSQIEAALNTWQFTNNAWGSVVLTLNYGSKKVQMDLSELKLQPRVDVLYISFYSCFTGRTGDIEFKKAQGSAR